MRPDEFNEPESDAEPRSAVESLIDRCARGELSPAVTAMRLVLAGGRPGELVAQLEPLARGAAAPQAARLGEIQRLLRERGERCAALAARIGESDEGSIDACRSFFDWAVGEEEDASVALYTLGDPALVRRATDDVVAVLEDWSVLGRGRSALEVGSGIGRLQAALSPRLAELHGVDISPRMIDVARRRCAHLPNVFFTLGSGRDLAPFPDERFDLVLAVDTFPYLVAAGPGVVEAHFREAARVLRPHGDLVVFNYSYRGDPEADRAEIATLADAYAFTVLVPGVQPFTIWDGTAYHLRQRGGADFESRPTLRP